MLRLAPGPAQLVDEVPSGRVFLDGRVLVEEGAGLSRARRALGFAGIVAITLVVDGKGRVVADPSIILDGIPEPVHAAVREAAAEAVRRSPRGDEEALRENVRRAARRAAQDAWGKKPVTRVEIAWI
jgi:ribonuclease J